MKPFFATSIVAAGVVLLCALGIGAQTSSPSATPTTKAHAPARHVMAPPLKLRATAKLRPSTAEAGQLRTAKPPLRILPAMHATAQPVGKTAGAPQHSGHWLLLYRTEHCVACDRLMNVLAASQSVDLRNGVPYTIIVGGSSSSAVNSVRAKYRMLADAAWAADLDGSSFKLLQLRGAPELFALDGNRIIWRVSGNLGNPQQVLRMADSWIAGTAAADAATKEPSAGATNASITAAPAKQ